MKAVPFTCISLLIFGFVQSCYSKPNERKNYDGYKVLEVVPRHQQTVDALRKLMLEDDALDFWSEPSYVNNPVQFMVPPENLDTIVRQLQNSNIEFTTYLDNVQDLLEPMWKEIDARAAKTNLAFDIDDFNALADITAWLGQLVSQCRPGLNCQLTNLGNSFENRPIHSFRISKPGENRKSIFIDATIHAREWIATATILKILDALVTGSNQEAIDLTEAYDFHIVPVVNPDGYSYSWTSDRMWRKNRKPIGACYGTDLNRNFNQKWGTDGVSHSPCSNTFCGEGPASERETVVIQNELLRIAPSVRALVTLHSYGRMWMFPWGNTVGGVCERTDDHSYLMSVADPAADAVQATYNSGTWARGNSCEVIYATSGSTQDYAKGGAGIVFSFTLELRGNNFIIDKINIDPSYREVWNGLVAMVNALPNVSTD